MCWGDKTPAPSASGAGNCPPGSSAPCPLQCKPIASIAITAVKFLSDHGLLKDYDTDWKDGGAVFPKPEWTPAKQAPISHTMDQAVQIEVTLQVTPADACPETGTLHGEGPGGMTFEQTGVSFKPGEIKLTLTSDAAHKIEKKIQELNFQISWTSPGTSVSVSPSTTSNTMFVTMGTPTAPRQPGITLKRMRHAVKATGGANSLDPHAIVKSVMSKWSSFNLSQVYDNEWELADDKTYPSGPKAGQLVGADCQTIVRHTESVIRMVGCPGKADFIVVWAKVPTPTHGEENLAYTPNMSSPKRWYNDNRPSRADRASWRATLVDGSGGQNRYEACLRFTYPEGSSSTADMKYYAGGVDVFNNANEVIGVFTTMSWRDENTGLVTDAIHTYPH
jgi:hypothetical protein